MCTHTLVTIILKLISSQRKIIMANKYKEKQRMNSANEYIDNLFENHSKILAVRLDLSYKDNLEEKPTFDRLKRDLQKLRKNRRHAPSVFDGMIGYVMAAEQGELEEKLHCHAVVLYDGQKVQHDVFKGQQIGEYWQNNITNGDGNYFNCNAKKEKYDKNGIGMIGHRDAEKRENLKKAAASYLTKDEQVVSDSEGKRTFFRGKMPKGKSNAGRPRKD